MTVKIAEHMTPMPHSIGADQPLARAIAFMREHRVRHLPVLHGGELVGMLSDRDVVLLEGLPTALDEAMLVEEAMMSEPFAVPSDHGLAEALREMAERHLGAVVVMDGPRVIGIYTSTDAVRMLSERL